MSDPRGPNTVLGRGARVRIVWAIVVVAVGAIVYRLAVAEPNPREAALRLAKEGKLADAEPLLVRAAERDGTDAEVIAELAMAKLGGTDADAAHRYLSRWCELRPTEARPFQLRMDLRHRTARGMRSPADRVRMMEAALADGRRVLELDPGNDAVRREVVWLALHAGQHAEAEAESRQSLASAPDDPWLNYLHARILHTRGRRDEAAAVLDPVVRAQPGFTDALLLRATLFHEADQSVRAVPLLRQALEQKGCPRRDCLYRLGLALAAAGQEEEARKVMAEVELLNLTWSVTNDRFPKNPAMRVQIAEAMLGVGRADEANAELDAVLAAAPDFAPAHRVKALYYDRIGQPDRAAEHRRRGGQGPP
jgi:predicted Zn-dependent protease